MDSRLQVVFIETKSIKELIGNLEGTAIIIAKRSKPKYDHRKGKYSTGTINLKCIVSPLNIVPTNLKSYSMQDMTTGKFYKGYTLVTVLKNSITQQNIDDLKEVDVKNLSKHVTIFGLKKELNYSGDENEKSL